MKVKVCANCRFPLEEAFAVVCDICGHQDGHPDPARAMTVGDKHYADVCARDYDDTQRMLAALVQRGDHERAAGQPQPAQVKVAEGWDSKA